jgi:cytochrome c peroxidase
MLWLLLFALKVPLGLDTHVPVPGDNPLTEETVALGRKLFFDKRLSKDNSLACATCHDPKRAFTDEHPTARGINNQIGPRRSPRILNRAWGTSFFWDGRAATLEDQVVQPIANPIEMGLPLDDAIARLNTIVEYKPITEQQLRRALASYVRTILAGNSPYDRYLAGDRTALDTKQQKGLQLFRGKAGCISCHLGPNLTDEDFHQTDAGKNPKDKGRNGAFKTPSLRQVAEAAPYFHDGSASTLEAVLDHYDKGGTDQEMRPLKLTTEEKHALVAFLKALTGTIQEGL